MLLRVTKKKNEKNKPRPQVNEQLSVILLSNWIAVIKTEAHTRKTEPGYPGNSLADFHAKSASTKTVPIRNLNELHKIDSNQIIYDNLYKRQNQASELEQQCWDQQGCKFPIKQFTGGQDSCLVLPESLKVPLLKALHSATHRGTDKMIQIMKKYWWNDYSKVTNLVYHQYLICQTHNPGKTIKVLDGAFSPPTGQAMWTLTDGFHSLASLNGLLICSCNCLYVLRIDWSLPMQKGWCRNCGRETFRKYISFMTLPQRNLQW